MSNWQYLKTTFKTAESAPESTVINVPHSVEITFKSRAFGTGLRNRLISTALHFGKSAKSDRMEI